MARGRDYNNSRVKGGRAAVDESRQELYRQCEVCEIVHPEPLLKTVGGPASRWRSHNAWVPASYMIRNSILSRWTWIDGGFYLPALFTRRFSLLYLARMSCAAFLTAASEFMSISITSSLLQPLDHLRISSTTPCAFLRSQAVMKTSRRLQAAHALSRCPGQRWRLLRGRLCQPNC